MIQRYLLVWLCLSSGLAYFWPQLVAQHSGRLPPWLNDPWSAGEPFLWHMIAVTMFAIGYMLPRDEVRQVARRWPTVLGGTAAQYTAMPLIAFLVGSLFRLDQGAMVGMMIVGCVPGAMASNVLTLNARGNTSYSVSLTTSATILSPLVVPLLFWFMIGEKIPFSPANVAENLAKTVVVPVVAGHVLQRLLPSSATWIRSVATAVANLTILYIIAVVVGLQRDELGWTAGIFVLPLLLVNLGGYLAGYSAGAAMGVPEPMRRALTLEIGMQNAGLGTVLAVKHFEVFPTAAILPATYTFGCMLTGTILARLWAMAAEKRERQPPKDGDDVPANK
jgi:BASS family bile acid:Na+ symporter